MDDFNANDPTTTSSSSPEWDVGFDRIPTVELSEDLQVARVLNFRNFRYECDGSHTPHWETREFQIDDVCDLEFIVVPFSTQPHLAHTMVSFGFKSGQHISISVEARRRWKQPYSIIKGLFGAFPLMYVIADERDTIGLRTEYRQDVVHLYPSSASAAQAKQLLLSMLRRASQLSVKPESYNTLTNNCLTNLRDHTNEIWPRRVRWSWRIVFNGHVGYLAYQLGLLKGDDSFESLDKKARINDLAEGNWHREDFSKLIRAR